MRLHWIHSIIFGGLASVVSLQAYAAEAATSMAPSTSTQPSSTTTQSAQKAGEIFMEANQKEKGVVTLPSGLQYKILETGNGKKPSKSDTVTVDYEGTLLNGTVFDSSYKRGQPISFPVSGVIAGWQEALQLMPTGSTWMLYIPPKLAYGKAGTGGMIGPDETLIFKVHLISIQ